MAFMYEPALVALGGLLGVLGLHVPLRALTHAFIVLDHHEVLLLAFGFASLGPNEGLILIVCIAVIVRDLVLTVAIRVIKRLSKAFPEELDKPLVRGPIFIQAVKIQPAEVVSETFDALEYLSAPLLQVASLSVPLQASRHHPRAPLCQLYLLLDPLSYLVLVIPVESRVEQGPRRVAILEFRHIGIRAVRGQRLIQFLARMQILVLKLEHLVTQGVSLVFLGLHLDDILIQEGQDAAL